MTKIRWYHRLLGHLYPVSPARFVRILSRHCDLRRARGMHDCVARAYVRYDGEFGILVSAKRSPDIFNAIYLQLELVTIHTTDRYHGSTGRKVRSQGVFESRLIYGYETRLARQVIREFREIIWDYCDYQGDPQLYTLLDTDSASS